MSVELVGIGVEIESDVCIRISRGGDETLRAEYREYQWLMLVIEGA